MRDGTKKRYNGAVVVAAEVAEVVFCILNACLLYVTAVSTIYTVFPTATIVIIVESPLKYNGKRIRYLNFSLFQAFIFFSQFFLKSFENVTARAVSQEISAFYGTRRFITVFTTARNKLLQAF
jgi:hypothetical protein